MISQPLFDLPFLAATWDAEFRAYLASGQDETVRARLIKWAGRAKLKETSSEAAFIRLFFHDLWGYSLQGDRADGAYQCHPQFAVARAGQAGSTGAADLAIGNFGTAGTPATPQVLCEFKDIRSSLDSPQNRKGNARSPVQQGFDYLRESRTALLGNEPVEPQWAIVTDMNEFRLYHWSRGIAQCQRFVIATPDTAEETVALVADSDAARFQRFIFLRIFQPAALLAERGDAYLAKLLKNQLTHEAAIEEAFYREYRAYRETLFRTLVAANPAFPGTQGKLVRLAQRFLDRCIFLLFCEDMGKALAFPPNLYRDVLIRYSTDPLYGPDDSAPWDRLKAIFRAMDRGGPVGPHTINRFNGGLFEPLPDLENLHIPASIFCAARQGESASSLLTHPLTLLYFSAKYNFGIKNAVRDRTINFYTLGRIFEQSITELEIMEAEADHRPSLNLLTKRKRDGVYYTPEWVTGYIVEETVGARLHDIKAELDLLPDHRPSDSDVALYRAFLNDRRRTAPVAGTWLAGLTEYRRSLNAIRIADPACGSGAFLIQSLERLKREHRWVADETTRLTGHAEFWDMDVVVNDILSHNLYGVDINPESVEIAKLALWMHTATRDKPLSSLDHNIRCGNSLVAPDFYASQPPELFTETEREHVNAFDWHAAFPEVFAAGGFDCIVGNPPYVKLQHFRRVQPQVAEYLLGATAADGSPLYRSTRTGNFDLYLPFIEKGLTLLRPDGHMGFIAPNLWQVNEYGAALRALLHANRRLDRWVDFKSFQVFREAITYTALQFFTGRPNAAIRCAFAPDGAVAHIDWERPAAAIPYAELAADDTWNLLPDAERRLIDRLRRECKPLEDSCKAIIVGIQTSADDIYHLTRLAADRYRTAAGIDVAIEDVIMRPLVSGPEAKRYQQPKSDTYLLFPYDITVSRPALFPPSQMAARFPQAWAYLKSHESALRTRENRKMDRDDCWYGYNYPKNLDKQELPKLCVAQTVPAMRVSFDHEGAFFFNNVRVNGILPTSIEDGWYLLGILNAPVADFVFRRVAKPKDNGYFEANKQFIAPLPIPDATPEERRAVAAGARQLQDLCTRRRDLVDRLVTRLASNQTVPDDHTPDWLWADVGTAATWRVSSEAPAGATGRALNAWAKDRMQAALDARLAELDTRLRPGARFAVTHADDAVRVSIDGQTAIQRFGLPDAAWVALQWRHALRDQNVTEAFDGRRLLSPLLQLRQTADSHFRQTLLALDRELTATDAEIETAETDLNLVINRLYHVTPSEHEQITRK